MLQWAREWFEEVFKQVPENVNRYIESVTEFAQHLSTQTNNKLDILTKVKEFFETAPASYDECLVWARLVYEDLFVNKILQLLYMLPLDKVGADGTPFWSGAKLAPSPVPFDTNDPLHIEFLLSLADLRWNMYALPAATGSGSDSSGWTKGMTVGDVTTEMKQKLTQLLSSVDLPQFRPDSNVKIALTEEEAKQQDGRNSASAASEYVDVDTSCNQILAQLPKVVASSSTTGVGIIKQDVSSAASSAVNVAYRVQVIDFDKDIDSHMRVVSACANMRARNYRIPEADLHKARGIAGKIIPAVATTTAMVTGMICLEMMKFILDKPIDTFQNTFSNLALPLFTSAEPDPPKCTVTKVKGTVVLVVVVLS